MPLFNAFMNYVLREARVMFRRGVKIVKNSVVFLLAIFVFVGVLVLMALSSENLMIMSECLYGVYLR